MERTDRIYVPKGLGKSDEKSENTDSLTEEQKIAYLDKLQTEALRLLPIAPFAIGGIVLLIKAIAG